MDVGGELRARVESAYSKMKQHPRVVQLRAKLDLAGAGSAERQDALRTLETLRAAHEAAPGDAEAHFQYATALYSASRVDDAMTELLAMIKRDRHWNGDAAKNKLLTIFEAEGGAAANPAVAAARRRLNALWLTG